MSLKVTGNVVGQNLWKTGIVSCEKPEQGILGQLEFWSFTPVGVTFILTYRKCKALNVSKPYLGVLLNLPSVECPVLCFKTVVSKILPIYYETIQ